MISMGVYGLGVVPYWVWFFGMVAPGVLAHLIAVTYQQKEWNDQVNDEIEKGMPENPIETEAMVLDKQFDRQVELEVGGFARVRGWKQEAVTMDEIQPDQLDPDTIKYRGTKRYIKSVDE